MSTPIISRLSSGGYFRTLLNSRISNVSKIFDDRILVSILQDQTLADVFEKCSMIELPISTKPSDLICLPPDVLAYEMTNGNNKIELNYTCSEINGTGFGGMKCLPAIQLLTILNTYKNAAHEINEECEKLGENALIVVANSGREGAVRVNGKYPESANNYMICEKLPIVEKFAEQIGSFTNPCRVDSLDKFVTPYFEQIDLATVDFNKGIINRNEYNTKIKNAYENAILSMKTYDATPMVLLGYSRDVVECSYIKNGQPYLFGRRINGLVNDRAALNLSKKENKQLDYKKVKIMNVTFEEGGDKLSAYLARQEFNFSLYAKSLSGIANSRGFAYDVCGLEKIYRYPTSEEDAALIASMNNHELTAHRMKYFRGVTEKDGINGIMTALDDFLKIGLYPLFKPSGSGQSKGIIGYSAGESHTCFKRRFYENLKNIKQNFGRGAGYPFLVVPILNLAKTNKGERYDLRFVVYQRINNNGGSTVHTIPLILRKGSENIDNTNTNNFSPTNITSSLSKTRRPGTDFIIPLCRIDSLEQVKITQDQIKSMCLYFSAFQRWLLKTKYSRSRDH